MTRTRWAMASLVLLGSVAMAGAPSPQQGKLLQASMLVTGTVDIEPDGSVSHYTVDKQDQLPTAVTSLLGQSIPNWKFEPVLIAGVAVPARTKMSVQLLADQVDKTHFSIKLNSVDFKTAAAPTEQLSVKHVSIPDYPRELVEGGISATAYVALKIDRQGHVQDAVMEQVNLHASGTPAQMERGRNALARSILREAPRWTFHVPTTGPEAAAPYWSGILPVAFQIGSAKPRYGQWTVYVPGPIDRPQWLRDTDNASQWRNPGTLEPGMVGQVGDHGPHLLTPLSSG